MFKKEVAERAARVMGNVIRGPISKKDHELLQSYLKGPRQLSPQECNWHVPTAKMTDLTREMRHMGIVGDGYMNFKDMMRGYRKSKGLPTWDQLKPLKDASRREKALKSSQAEIPDRSFSGNRVAGQIPLDDYHSSHNNRKNSWKNATKRWAVEYEGRAGAAPFVLGYHTSIADLQPGDKIHLVRDVSHVNPKGPGVGERVKKKK